MGIYTALAHNAGVFHLVTATVAGCL